MRPSPVRHRSAPAQRLGQAAHLGHQRHPALEPRAAGAGQRPAQAARRAGPGQRAQVAPGRGGQRVGQPGQHAVEERHVAGRGALLRAVDRRRAVRAEQRVVDVAGDGQIDRAQPRVEPGQIDPRQPRQRLRHRVELGPGRVEKARSERRQRAGTAVGRGAAADPEHDPGRAAGQRVAQQLAGAAGGGAARGAPPAQQCEAGRGGHLDHGQRAVAGVDGLDRLAERPADSDPARLRAAGQERIDRAVAAVGHRHQHAVRGRNHVADPGGESRRDGGGAEAALELVRRDDHAHRRATTWSAGCRR